VSRSRRTGRPNERGRCTCWLCTDAREKAAILRERAHHHDLRHGELEPSMPTIEFLCPSCQRTFERDVTPKQLAAAMQAFNRGEVPKCKACERGYQEARTQDVPGVTHKARMRRID